MTLLTPRRLWTLLPPFSPKDEQQESLEKEYKEGSEEVFPESQVLFRIQDPEDGHIGRQPHSQSEIQNGTEEADPLEGISACKYQSSQFIILY